MRTVISVIVAVSIFIFVAYLVQSGNVVQSDYWTALAVALTITGLTVLTWGQKPRIMKLVKGKKTAHEDKVVTKPSSDKVNEVTGQFAKEVKKGIKKDILLEPNTIIKLKIDNSFLDNLYQQAYNQAINIHPDAKLSTFTIQVFPFAQTQSKVNIYLDFYSKIANKLTQFRFDEFSSNLEQRLPIRPAKHDFQKAVFADLPWKVSPHWMQFLERVYSIIRPIHPATATFYHLRAMPYGDMVWSVDFNDEFTGEAHRFSWNGEGFDEKSFRKES
jgi:hypothetical protein